MEEKSYEIVLACALKLIGMIEADPGMPKYVMLSRFVYEILDTLRAALPEEEWTVSFMEKHDTRTVIHALSIRLAKQCRELIQGGFREEEWIDIDIAFYEHIRAGLKEFNTASRKKMCDQQTHHN